MNKPIIKTKGKISPEISAIWAILHERLAELPKEVTQLPQPVMKLLFAKDNLSEKGQITPLGLSKIFASFKGSDPVSNEIKNLSNQFQTGKFTMSSFDGAVQKSIENLYNMEFKKGSANQERKFNALRTLLVIQELNGLRKRNISYYPQLLLSDEKPQLPMVPYKNIEPHMQSKEDIYNQLGEIAKILKQEKGPDRVEALIEEIEKERENIFKSIDPETVIKNLLLAIRNGLQPKGSPPAPVSLQRQSLSIQAASALHRQSITGVVPSQVKPPQGPRLIESDPASVTNLEPPSPSLQRQSLSISAAPNVNLAPSQVESSPLSDKKMQALAMVEGIESEYSFAKKKKTTLPKDKKMLVDVHQRLTQLRQAIADIPMDKKAAAFLVGVHNLLDQQIKEGHAPFPMDEHMRNLYEMMEDLPSRKKASISDNQPGRKKSLLQAFSTFATRSSQSTTPDPRDVAMKIILQIQDDYGLTKREPQPAVGLEPIPEKPEGKGGPGR